MKKTVVAIVVVAVIFVAATVSGIVLLTRLGKDGGGTPKPVNPVADTVQEQKEKDPNEVYLVVSDVESFPWGEVNGGYYYTYNDDGNLLTKRSARDSSNVRTNVYNENGDLVTEYYNDRRVEHIYENGQKVRKEVYEYGELREYYNYEYDAGGKRIRNEYCKNAHHENPRVFTEETVYNSDDRVATVITYEETPDVVREKICYEYSTAENGNETVTIFYYGTDSETRLVSDEPGSFTVNEYDAQGNKVKVTTQASEGEWQTVRLYNQYGQKTEEGFLFLDDGTGRYEKRFYCDLDENGRVLTEYSIDGYYDEVWVTATYEYDENGNVSVQHKYNCELSVYQADPEGEAYENVYYVYKTLAQIREENAANR